MQGNNRVTKLPLALSAASELPVDLDPDKGPCVLGIDAAWTTHQPSGIALVQNTASAWSCLAIAPSYEAFIAQASGQPWDPEQKATGSRPDPAALLQASKQIAGSKVSCVSVDMPLAM